MPQLLAVLALSLIPLAPENLRVTTVPPATADPDRPVTWRFEVENVSGKDLPAAPVSIYFSGGRIASVQPDLACTEVDGGAGNRCTLPVLGAGQSLEIEVAVQHPFRHGRASAGLTVSYTPTMPENFSAGAAFWREVAVTTTADAGPGSLRQTIIDINATPECQYRPPAISVPCKAAFHITDPVPAEGWYTVRPATPLPAMTAFDMSVDGSTQTAANTLGPQVALDGSALMFGHGLMATSTSIHSTRAEVRGLAIGGFPWNGIFSGPLTDLAVRECYIGVDPTGRRANGNGSRGIVSSLMRGNIQNNVIGGNARSGIFFMGQMATGPNIRNNRIGVGAHDDTPIGNGASGIFISDFWGYYTYPTIEGNVIANNAHFGIAMTPNAPMMIMANTIRDNGQGGIDIGLDGPTESSAGVPGVGGGVIPPPVIQSATYANGVTTIKGYSLAGNNRRQVLLYANSKLEDGDLAEGEQYLGITPVQYREDTSFTFEYPGDLRGRYINGTSVAVTFWGLDEYSYTSSEFGRAVAVADQ